MEKLIDISSYPVANVLDILLQDKSTKKNIIWATDTYEELGEGFIDKVQMNMDYLLLCTDLIRPRIQKTQDEQAQRTRKKAEVFTPAWLCNKMNNHCDEEWFGRKNVFNTENDDHTYTVTEGKIKFPKGKKWQHYVDCRRLEITCGEAPYLVSRYDVSTGELIVPPIKRIGILDRKLRIVNENTDTYDEWLIWTLRAFEASYGYEYQGDNLLIARSNLLMSFADYFEERWERQPDNKLLRQTANIIAKNIWQMDGLKGTVPLGKPYEEYNQLYFFDVFGTEDEHTPENEAVPCKIYDWRSKVSLKFIDLKEMQAMGKKLFDYVIGNPPYQEETANEGDRKPPVYNLFMDNACIVADIVELITPARFLFNAGQTPKAWNEKMLNNEHFNVLYYEPDATKIFANTEIKGGVCISIINDKKNYGSIGMFTIYNELNSIIKKIIPHLVNNGLDSIICSQGLYRFSPLFFKEHPEAKEKMGAGTGNKIVSSVMEKLTDVFVINASDDEPYVRLLGRINKQRGYRYIKRKYIVENDAIDKYNLFIPEANNSGKYGEQLTDPIVGKPNDGTTDTYLSAGIFETEKEPLNFSVYMKTKFFRALLGVKKVTQHCPPTVWKMIPLQDFTENSDIDWSKSVAEIDRQLYKKYGLTQEEIDFIETHVKEMA